jgi:arsenate reductase
LACSFAVSFHPKQKVNSLKVQILHNPRCSKSRATLEVLKNQGIDPEIIPYLETPPDPDQLATILELLNMRPRDLMRKGQAEYKQLGLDNEALSDAALLSAMCTTPILIERPIVIANGKAAIGRPPESVLDIL